ncbi:MAG: NADH-ubiquinone oxidoreductase-F iron-sulfur binding region domain-containing protein [Patescibacteria group bacterium]
MAEIIEKLKAANLLGRGGASFPTWQKWEIVKNCKADKKYIVANGSEGEPATFKDGYILEHYPADLINGLKIALDIIDHAEAFIFLNKKYYEQYKSRLESLIGDLPIKVFKESGGYLSGEETMVCQEIEKGLLRPRQKPPFTAQVGIFGKPTLINNIETFYYVAKIAQDDYKQTRFYSISGHVKHPGVYELPVAYDINKVLLESDNWPVGDFFVQAGGGASGEILLPQELHVPTPGGGVIVVYDRKKTDPYKLLVQWADFFIAENCDKCTPCREGIYRLREMFRKRKIDKGVLDDMIFVLENTSFCPLGKMAALPCKSLIKKLSL